MLWCGKSTARRKVSAVEVKSRKMTSVAVASVNQIYLTRGLQSATFLLTEKYGEIVLGELMEGSRRTGTGAAFRLEARSAKGLSSSMKGDPRNGDTDPNAAAEDEKSPRGGDDIVYSVSWPTVRGRQEQINNKVRASGR